MSLVDESMLPFQWAYVMIFGEPLESGVIVMPNTSHVRPDLRGKHCFRESLLAL